MSHLFRNSLIIAGLVAGYWVYSTYWQDKWVVTAFITDLDSGKTIPATDKHVPTYKSKRECIENLGHDMNTYGKKVVSDWENATSAKYQVEFKCSVQAQPEGFLARFHLKTES